MRAMLLLVEQMKEMRFSKGSCRKMRSPGSRAAAYARPSPRRTYEQPSPSRAADAAAPWQTFYRPLSTFRSWAPRGAAAGSSRTEPLARTLPAPLSHPPCASEISERMRLQRRRRWMKGLAERPRTIGDGAVLGIGRGLLDHVDGLTDSASEQIRRLHAAIRQRPTHHTSVSHQHDASSSRWRPCGRHRVWVRTRIVPIASSGTPVR